MKKKNDSSGIGGFPVQFPRSEDVSLRIVLRNPQGNDRFKVAIGGDVCPGKSGAGIVARGAAGEVFGELKTFLEGCNLCAVQWETPLASELSPIVKTGPKLNSPPSSVRLLEGFFSVALLANNHLGDQGPANVIETLEVLNRAGIRTVGAGRNRSEARTPLRLTQEGRRITLVNLCENEFGTATETVPGTAGQEPLEDLELVRREAAACDLLLVVLHGGHEYNPFPSPRLQSLCRAFAAAGADAVLNCHTHCPEGIEIFQGVPIVYSPGNLYFPKDARKYAGNSIWWYGFLPKFHFDEVGVFELEILPYRFDNSGVHVLPERQLEYFRQYFNRLCEVLADRKMLERYFEAWSAVRGQQYLAESLGCISATWEQELSLPKTRADLMGMRNLFCCESHHDMVRCFLHLVEQNRVKEAASLFPELQALRNAPENWE